MNDKLYTSKKKIFHKILLLSMLTVFCSPLVGFSAIHQITSNGAYNREASLYNGTIAWHSDVGGDWEIYYWDGNQIHQITNNAADDTNPSLYNGTIAWSSDVDGDFEIYYWDGNAVHQITNNDQHDTYPSLYDGTIAWSSGEGQGIEIRYWDGNTTISIAKNNRYFTKPSLYNGEIAYNGNVSNLLSGVYYWNGVETIRITDEWEYGYYETLYDGTIAWHDDYIYYWDGSTIHPITKGGYDTTEPSLHSGKIAWEGGGIGFWDGTTIHQITTNNDRYPSTFNGTIAWERHTDTGSEIFYWDGNDSPIADAGIDQSVTVGKPVTLDGTGSYDPDGSIDSWKWLLEHENDSSLNKTAIGEKVDVDGLREGSFTVTLTVTDNYGDSTSDTMSLEMVPFPWILFHPIVR